jgi:hypothetical protein
MDRLSESDVSKHLSYLMQRPIPFRLRITPNKELALIDVAIIFTGLNNDHAGYAVRRLLEQYPEFRSNIAKFKFPGRGRQTVDVAPLEKALEFAFLLPGRAASKVRKEAAKLLVRYIGGDRSLIDEICQINRVQVALAEIPEDERTAEQQTVRLFGESVENTTMKLTIVPAPEGLVPSSSQRDAYVMRVLDTSARQFWKIGRSDDPLSRADQLDCQMRRDGLCWHHEVDTIFRHGGIMESLLHREFQGMRMENTKEYFLGPTDFPGMVARAMVALLPKQMELQFQDRRKSETRGGLEEDPAFKRRKFELELARDELSLKKDQAKFDADARVAAAKADADVRVAAAKADAEVMIIIAKAEAEALRIRAGSEAEENRTRGDLVQQLSVINTQPLASAVDQLPDQSDLTGIWATPGGAQFLQAFRMAKCGRRQYPMKATDLYLRGAHLGNDVLGFLQKNPLAFQMARTMAQAEARRLRPH